MTKPTFLLVHGAWHGAWCWDRLIPAIERAGGLAAALDLPGHGAGERPGWGVTMDDYARAIVGAARDMTAAIAVGHSMGGLAISRAAELNNSVFSKLVYLCAFLPRDGDSLMRLGAEDGASLVPTITRPNPIRGTISVRADGARDVFYADCADADIALAQARLQAQSIRPLIQKVHVTPEGFGRVRRYYIACSQDRAISLPFQQKMLARVGCEDAVTIAASHSPFLSQPDAVAAALMRFAAA